ncbi:hypothetical protein GWI33_012572 [Rhynchophorus ferrugineus]|uniref:Uncharacterized protein n=1 Tax=Rhynchophorus ferrugineus TaxID=354439 RepID=A0A834I8P2_RHYFE|nr:hypothetical protein GWI33_012572 [Rhynchophorus ferrugineus]
MFSMKVVRNRSCREVFRQLRRAISKTSTDKNSDAISRLQDNSLSKLELNVNQNGSYQKWMKHMQHKNVR